MDTAGANLCDGEENLKISLSFPQLKWDFLKNEVIGARGKIPMRSRNETEFKRENLGQVEEF